jgi:hypothetical protein
MSKIQAQFRWTWTISSKPTSVNIYIYIYIQELKSMGQRYYWFAGVSEFRSGRRSSLDVWYRYRYSRTGTGRTYIARATWNVTSGRN